MAPTGFQPPCGARYLFAMWQHEQIRTIVKWTGLAAGPVLAGICMLTLPVEYQSVEGKTVAFTLAGRATLSIMVWMAVWWLTEAMHISVTALLPLVLFPICGVMKIDQAAAPYANKLIFLFFGGFMLALSMQRWGLDKRIALLTLSRIGTQPSRMIGGFMLVTATLSAFVSNTATTAMMLPIALSVVALMKEDDSSSSASEDARPSNFAACLLLCIAYAASIGGMATLIGTPPNAVLAGFLKDKIAEPYRMDVSMAGWLKMGLPLVAVFLPLVWLLMTKVIFRVGRSHIAGAGDLIREQLHDLGKPSRGEWTTFIVFSLTAAAWIARKPLMGWEISEGYRPLAGLSDAGIAMTAALVLFVTPVSFNKMEFTLDWDTARKAPWGIFILFGGGLSLAGAVDATGAAEFIGSQATYIGGAPTILVVLIVCTGVVFLTELTSNVATTATLIPVLAALAPELDVHPYWLIFPATLAASFAFMLPVATPPNAIVFGSGHVTIAQMAKAGLWLNLIGIAVITLITMLLIGPLLGIQ